VKRTNYVTGGVIICQVQWIRTPKVQDRAPSHCHLWGFVQWSSIRENILASGLRPNRLRIQQSLSLFCIWWRSG